MQKVLDDYGWKEAFGYAGEPGTCGHACVSPCVGTDTDTSSFTREDVSDIFALQEGENDGDNWKILGKLNDGRYFFLSAGCDYTGWDCQAGGCAIVDTDRDHLIKFGLGRDDRDDLGVS